MAEPTQQDYENAGRDLTDLGLIVNGAADLPNPGHAAGTVTTREGGTVRTIRNVIEAQETQENAATADADRAEAAADSVEKNLTPAPIGGDLAAGLLAGQASWFIPPDPSWVVPATDPEMIRRGAKYVVNVPAGQQIGIRCDWSHPVFNGDYVLGSVVMKKTGAGAFPTGDYFTVGNVPIAGAQQGFTLNNGDLLRTEAVNADVQRLVVGGHLTTLGGDLGWSYLFINNTSATVLSVGCFGIGESPRFHSDLDYRNYDPFNEVATEARLLALETPPVDPTVTTPFPIGGNLPGGAPTAQGSWLVPPEVVATANAYLNGIDIDYETKVESGDGGSYFRVDLTDEQVFGNGDWIIASVLLRKDPADSWGDILTGDYFTISTVQNNGAQPESIGPGVGDVITTEDVAPNIKRLQIIHHYVSLTDNIDWFIIFPHAIAGKTVYHSGFAMALSHTQPTSLDWQNWGGTSGGSSAVIDLLVPSSYHLVRGRPLRLFRDGLTAQRELIDYDIAAIGINADRVGEEWASPMMRLDGTEFSGGGFFRAKRRGKDETTGFYQKAVSFYSSAANKAGAPRILIEGDSLHNNGIISSLKAKLLASGVNPVFVGTVTDAGGTFGEARPNWMATTFNYAQRWPNGHGNGHIYEAYPLRPNGGNGLVINVTKNGGGTAVQSAAASGGTGYPNGTWEIVFSGPRPNGAGLRRARGRITVTGGVPGAIVIEDGGVYSNAEVVTAQIVPSFSEYLAMDTSGGYGPRWQFNPFLRPATGGEISANDPRIQNGYIYDPAYYVANFLGGTPPDLFIICLGMNDLWGGGGTPSTAFAAIKQQVDSWHAAYPGLPIAVAIPGQGTIEIWTGFVSLTKLLLDEYDAREAQNLYVLPLFQATDAKFIFPMTVGGTDPQTGVQTISIADPTHPEAIGRSQQAEMEHGWVMNRL